MAPDFSPWTDSEFYPALYGYTEVEAVTFAGFGQPCSEGPRTNLRDYAISGIVSPDTWSPVHTKMIQKDKVAPGSEVFFPDPRPEWIREVHVIKQKSLWCTQHVPTCSCTRSAL